jgi:hypothetical protein
MSRQNDARPMTRWYRYNHLSRSSSLEILAAVALLLPSSSANARFQPLTASVSATSQVLEPTETLSGSAVPRLLCVEMFLDRSHVGATPTRDLVERLGTITEGEWINILDARARFKKDRGARESWVEERYSVVAAGRPDPRANDYRRAMEGVDLELLRRRVREVAGVYLRLLRALPRSVADALDSYVRPPYCAGAHASLNTADPEGFDSERLAIWFSFDELLEDFR